MECSINDVQLKAAQNWTTAVKNTISEVRKHDCTRKELSELLDKMLESVETIIRAEKEKEEAEKLRDFFLKCAENAEEIAKIIKREVLR